MNLKTTLQTLRRIERLLDGWQSSGDIPAIERDLACDLLRRAYDDIFFSDRNAATEPEASLAENTPGLVENTLGDRMDEKAVGEVADAGDAPVADTVSPVGLAGLAPSGEVAEETPGESPENAEAADDPAAENASAEVPAEEDAFVGMPVDGPVSVEKSVEEDIPVEEPVGEVAEEEVPVEEFRKAGDAVEEAGEAGDAVSSAEVVATPIPETSADVVIDPVFEVFADGDADAEEPEDANAAETVDLVETVNVMDAVEAAGAAEDTEIAEEMEVVEEMEAEETEIEQSVADPVAIRSVAATVEPAAESGPEPVSDPAPAGTAVGEATADVAASNAETLEEMAARFKNASGRRRKSRRAFMSLYDDDETARSGKRSDQLELSDWGIEPSDPSAKRRHTRELFGLPVDDSDTTSEPTPQPAAEATDGEMEVEVVDFADDDNLSQSDPNAKPALEATAALTEPTPRPAVAPTREERDDVDDDLPFDEAIVALDDPDDAPSAVPSLEPLGSPEHSESPESPESSDTEQFDSIEIVEIADVDEEVPGIEEDEIQHTDRAEVADEPAESEMAAPASSATEPAAVRGLYGREEKPDLPASTTVLGEVMGHDVPTVGDSLGRRPDVAGWADVSDDLNRAISVGDRFVLLRDLFDGDQALCDRTLKRLSTFDDLDDCMIWITENFAWNANSEGAKLIMGLLERKLG